MAKSLTKATPVDAWKRAEPESVTLPSGNTAKLNRPNMYVLIKTGQVPSEMMRLLEGDEDMTFIERQSAIEWQVAVAFVEPEVVLGDREEGKLHIDDIEDRDKSYVIEFIGSNKNS
jgi:hypothetical protein